MNDCIARLVQEMIPFMGILSTERDVPRVAMIERAIGTFSHVPFFELPFLPDGSFWNCTEKGLYLLNKTDG